MVNVAARIFAHADRIPDHPAVKSAAGSYTYEGLRSASLVLGGRFVAAGLEPLDCVVFIAPSVVEFAPVYYGLHSAGITVITMNTMATAPEIGYVLDDAQATLVIAWHECQDAARTAADERSLPFWRLDAEAGLAAVLGSAVPAYDHEPDDTAIILYTSGTTGRPKGAELTAANLVDTPSSFVPVLNLDSDDRFGTALPLFHVYGQAVVMNTSLASGCTLNLLSPFEPRAMLELLRAERLTAIAGVPTMWNAMLHAAEGFGPEDFAHLRLATSGGASLPVEVIRAFSATFDCTLLEGYGLTESTGAATFNDINRPQKAGTVGPALPGTTVEVRDSDGVAVAPGVVGEVFLKGPTIMKGYRNRPEATAAELQDGWLKTGDLGVLDEDGYLSIVDRAKDLIIRGGYNVYPREVEEVLYEHPEIVEVAVVGVPDEHYGELVAAVVVLRPGSALDGPGLRTWAKTQLSAYKVPTLYHFVDALPKGPTGKILKRAIDRDELLQGAEVTTAAAQ